MREEQNPSPEPEQARYGVKIIEELKAAGEELKEISPPEFGQKEEKLRPIEKKVEEASPRLKEERFDLFKKINEYQGEIAKELSALEKTHQEIKGLEKKLEQRIELLKRLRDKSIQINKEFKQFQEELILAKKENKGLLGRVNQFKKR